MTVGRGATNADGHASQRARRHERLERPLIAAVTVGDDIGKPLRKLGREPTARKVDEHRHPLAGWLGNLEHADHPPLLKPDDLAHELGNLRRRQLEDEVPGKVFEHRPSRPSRVAVHRLSDKAQLAGDLVAETGNVEHARPLRCRRQEADESVLAASDVRVDDDEDTESLGTEHPRHRVRPRQHGRAPFPCAGRRERERRQLVRLRVGELAEGGAVDRRHLAEVVTRRVDGSEEHEVAIGEPLHRRVHVDEPRATGLASRRSHRPPGERPPPPRSARTPTAQPSRRRRGRSRSASTLRRAARRRCGRRAAR